MPWSLLLNKWVLIGVLIAALFGWGTFEHWNGQRYKAERDAAKEQVKALGVEIDAQNKAVDALKVEGDRREKAARDGLAAVQAHVRTLGAEAARLGALAGAAKPTARPAGCPESGADRAVQAVREGLGK